jgi:hypothetical protein
MRNNQRRNNQTNQGCVGVNLRVCPAMTNTIHAERSVFRYARAKSKALALRTLLHIDCKAGALLLTRRSEGRYAERGTLRRARNFPLRMPVQVTNLRQKTNHILNLENKFNNNLIINDVKNIRVCDEIKTLEALNRYKMYVYIILLLPSSIGMKTGLFLISLFTLYHNNEMFTSSKGLNIDNPLQAKYCLGNRINIVLSNLHGSLKRCKAVRLTNHILNLENKFNNNLIINDLKNK